MSDSNVDSSATDAVRDVATVDSSGSSLDVNLAGVVTKSPAVHVDHRGRLFEVYPGPDEFWADPVVFCHAFTVRPHGLKGWGLHFHKTDRYTLMVGEVMVALWDARLDSPTHGRFQRVFLSAEGVRQVSIPPGVWHATINLVSTESMVIDFPTQPYDHADPDKIRLSWDTPLAPVDLADYFPVQFDSGRERPCC